MNQDNKAQRMIAGAAAWEQVFTWSIRAAEAVIKALVALTGTCLGCIAAAREYQTLTRFFFEFASTLGAALAMSVIVWLGLVSARSGVTRMFSAEPREWFVKAEAKFPWLGRIADATPHLMLVMLILMLLTDLAPVIRPLYWFGHHWKDGMDAAVCETRWRTAPEASLSPRCAALRAGIDG